MAVWMSSLDGSMPDGSRAGWRVVKRANPLPNTTHAKLVGAQRDTRRNKYGEDDLHLSMHERKGMNMMGCINELKLT